MDSELPGYQRAIANGVRFLAEIEGEFGLFSSVDVAARGIDPGSLIWVERDGERLYPGFQLSESGEVPAVVYRLAQVAEEVGWSRQSVVFRRCSPSGRFDGDRPIDHLGDKHLVEIAKNAWETDW